MQSGKGGNMVFFKLLITKRILWQKLLCLCLIELEDEIPQSGRFFVSIKKYPNKWEFGVQPCEKRKRKETRDKCA
ncbi:hypothetical protein COCON_G00208430 [Conger conger]|uniref:Secreted protein n=1 Tax=Conger conger TaxID=82655 RepID=A0A9Q1D046_CONCO|nr:hypothetical protein COCON_G00208430 [Conger conger]